MSDEEFPETKETPEEDVYILDDSEEETYDDVLRELEDEAGSAEEHGLQLSEDQSAVEGEDTSRLRAENEELKDRWMRTRADFENYKRRSEREKRETYDQAVAQTVRHLLPVIDNFDRALQSARDHSADASVIEGIEMISLQLREVLESLAVEIIEETDVEFDPEIHEAVQTVAEPSKPPHTVVTVMQKGYKLRERLIRPAMVIVSASGEETREGEGAADSD